jgi:hypothetical protein
MQVRGRFPEREAGFLHVWVPDSGPMTPPERRILADGEHATVQWELTGTFT